MINVQRAQSKRTFRTRKTSLFLSLSVGAHSASDEVYLLELGGCTLRWLVRKGPAQTFFHLAFDFSRLNRVKPNVLVLKWVQVCAGVNIEPNKFN